MSRKEPDDGGPEKSVAGQGIRGLWQQRGEKSGREKDEDTSSFL